MMMNTTNKTLLLTLGLSLGAVAIASPAEARPWRGGGIARVDVNDGAVTAREFRRFHRRNARRLARELDRNLDGWLSEREVRMACGGRWGEFDLDHDGVETRFERKLVRRSRRGGMDVRDVTRLAARLADRDFDRLDWDHDGLLIGRELRGLRRELRGDDGFRGGGRVGWNDRWRHDWRLSDRRR